MEQKSGVVMSGFKFKEVWCSSCDRFEWHIQKYSGVWECLECRRRSSEKDI